MEIYKQKDFELQEMEIKELNEIIWFSVRGNLSEMPEIARLPAFELMTTGLVKEELEDEKAEKSDVTFGIVTKKREKRDIDD